MPQAIDNQQALTLGRALLAALGGSVPMAQKAAPGTPDASYMHGLGGLFATPAIERPVFSAMLLPQAGLQSQLPLVASDFDYPNYAIMTGLTATSGTDPSAACGTYPEIGNLKRVVTQLPFGRRGRATQVIDITRLGRIRDRGESVDLQFIGNAFDRDGVNASVPSLPGMQGSGNVLNDEISAQLFKLGAGMARDFARDLYTATPFSNPSPDPQSMTKYYYGLQSLVNTGYKDAQAGQLAPAADSLVRSFGNANISIAGAAGPAFVKELVYQARYLYRKAEQIGYGGTAVDWAWVMRPSMFYEVTAVWPCSYYTNRCTSTDTGNTNFTDAKALTEMRDEMRTGNFLWVDGRKIPVILDEAMPETEIGNGVFTSDIFYLPLKVDGIPTLYMEYFKYDKAIAAARTAYGPGAQVYFDVTDNGRFLVSKLTPTGTCIQFQAQFETRLVLRTPFLASRTTNVRYTPLIHEAEPFTTSSYFANGGITTTTRT